LLMICKICSKIAAWGGDQNSRTLARVFNKVPGRLSGCLTKYEASWVA